MDIPLLSLLTIPFWMLMENRLALVSFFLFLLTLTPNKVSQNTFNKKDKNYLVEKIRESKLQVSLNSYFTKCNNDFVFVYTGSKKE